MSGFRTGAAVRRIVVSTFMFAPSNAALRKKLGIEGIWNGYTPVMLLTIGVFEVVMLSGQVRGCPWNPDCIGRGCIDRLDCRSSNICTRRLMDHLLHHLPIQEIERSICL